MSLLSIIFIQFYTLVCQSVSLWKQTQNCKYHISICSMYDIDHCCFLVLKIQCIYFAWARYSTTCALRRRTWICQVPITRTVLSVIFSHVSAFSHKNKTDKIGLGGCVCVCVCLCTILVPPNNFQTSYPIDTKFRLHIVSYWNSTTALVPFLNFENCALEKFLKFIFLHLINMGKF